MSFIDLNPIITAIQAAKCWFWLRKQEGCVGRVCIGLARGKVVSVYRSKRQKGRELPAFLALHVSMNVPVLDFAKRLVEILTVGLLGLLSVRFS